MIYALYSISVKNKVNSAWQTGVCGAFALALWQANVLFMTLTSEHLLQFELMLCYHHRERNSP